MSKLLLPSELVDNQKQTWYDEEGYGHVQYDGAVNAVIEGMIQENKSILEMAKLHMDERAVLVIQQRIFELEKGCR